MELTELKLAVPIVLHRFTSSSPSLWSNQAELLLAPDPRPQRYDQFALHIPPFSARVDTEMRVLGRSIRHAAFDGITGLPWRMFLWLRRVENCLKLKAVTEGNEAPVLPLTPTPAILYQ